MGMRLPTEINDELPSVNSDTEKTALSCALRGVAADDVALTITSDITAEFPIGPAELDVFERYFGHLLDAVLGGSNNAATTLSRHKRVR